MYVDALAMDLIRQPEAYDVIVTNNLFGDILTDLGAALTGGLGVAASGNIHPGRISLFEPVHGSAPDIAGQGKANPIAMALTGALMLEHLGYTREAGLVQSAVEEQVREGARTPPALPRAPSLRVARPTTPSRSLGPGRPVRAAGRAGGAGRPLSRSSLSAPRMRHKPLRRPLRSSHISSSQALASDIEFSHHPNRHRLHPAIQHIHLHIPDRPPDRRSLPPLLLPLLLHHSATRHHRGLRRSIMVE